MSTENKDIFSNKFLGHSIKDFSVILYKLLLKSPSVKSPINLFFRVNYQNKSFFRFI